MMVLQLPISISGGTERTGTAPSGGQTSRWTKDHEATSPRGKAPRARRRQADSAPAIPDRRALEKALWELGRALRAQQFETIEQANAFLEKMDPSAPALGPPPE